MTADVYLRRLNAFCSDIHVKPKELTAKNESALHEHFLKLGYRYDPVPESRKEAGMTFVKPLPKGGQQHTGIWIGREYYKIEELNDKGDPNRDPVGHLVSDIIINGVPHDTYRIRRKRSHYARAHLSSKYLQCQHSSR